MHNSQGLTTLFEPSLYRESLDTKFALGLITRCFVTYPCLRKRALGVLDAIPSGGGGISMTVRKIFNAIVLSILSSKAGIKVARRAAVAATVSPNIELLP